MKIPIPTMGEVLQEEFLTPLNMSSDSLAKGTGIPQSEIQDILNGRRQVTLSISIKIGNFFGMSDKFFFNVQKDLNHLMFDDEGSNEHHKPIDHRYR